MTDSALTVRVNSVVGVAVAAAGDYWSVIDRWWRPEDAVKREYVELHLENGTRVVVYRENGGAWMRAGSRA